MNTEPEDNVVDDVDDVFGDVERCSVCGASILTIAAKECMYENCPSYTSPELSYYEPLNFND